MNITLSFEDQEHFNNTKFLLGVKGVINFKHLKFKMKVE